MRIQIQLDQFESDLLEMGNHTRIAIENAVKAFMSRDTMLALSVIEGDEFINAFEENINNQGIEILTLLQPVAKDLRLIIGGVKIANDLERIGDYAKNIARFVIKSKTVNKTYEDDIFKLAEIFLNHFDALLYILENKNVKEAYKVASLDDVLDTAFEGFMYELSDDSVNKEQFPLEMASIARNLERAGDHSKNVCEQIIYIVNGQHVDFG